MKLVGRHGRMKVPTLMGRKHGLGEIIFAGEGKDPLLKVQMQDGTIVTCLRSEFSIMRAGPLRSDDVVTRVPLEKHMRVGALNGRI